MAKARSSSPNDDAGLMGLMQAVVAGDVRGFQAFLDLAPGLASRSLASGATRVHPAPHFFEAIAHYVYEGDTALHIAGAAYRVTLAQVLIAKGADVHARNRRGAQPLHYAVDGGPTHHNWDPRAQAETIDCLIAKGADPNALDKSGVAPLHRAVRNRCTSAVRSLLSGGADPKLANKAGSTPLDLASWTTGRGGSGTPEAKREQDEIIRLLRG
jgi:ankyrin repeat protein